MDWFIGRLQHTNPTLDYKDLSNHEDDFRKLLDLKIIKHSQTLESLPCEWCEREHPLSPFCNSKDEVVISCFGNCRVVNPDELKIWTINRDALIENIKSRNPIIDEKIYKQTLFGINRPKQEDKNYLNSIYLVSPSLEPSSVIFLVLDGRFEMPIRCAVRNYKGGVSYIKKLYDIACTWDVPNKKVGYNKSLADNINNGLFRKRRVARHMRTNKFKKPTLVQKSENGKSLVLKNEIPVRTGLVKNEVPLQHQSLYIDKTK